MTVSKRYWILIYIALVRASVLPKTTPDLPEVHGKSPEDLKLDDDLTTKGPRLLEDDEDRRVYLEDVVFGLRSQEWKPEDVICLNSTLNMLASLQNKTLWAVTMWDSIPSEPRGLLYGARYQLGNFDECLHPEWENTNPELKAQYCMAKVALIRNKTLRIRKKGSWPFDPYGSALDKIYYQSSSPALKNVPSGQVTWGLCVPAVCSPRAVEQLMVAMLAHSSLSLAGLRFNVTQEPTCQSRDTQFTLDASGYAFIGFMAFLLFLAMVCSIVHYTKNASGAKASRLVQSFSIIKNMKSLSSMNDSGLESLYGIRYLSICLVVVGHRIGISTAIALASFKDVERVFEQTMTPVVLRADLLVDTFFMMAGLLTVQSLAALDTIRHPLIIVLRRYVRLVPGLAVVMWYMASVFPVSGSGPMWPVVVGQESPPCRNNLWLNLLMVSNYVDVDNMCMVVTWYVPCDFHMFVVCVALCWLHRRHRRSAVLLAVLLAMAALLSPAIVTILYKLPAVHLFNLEFLESPRSNASFKRQYITTHARAAAYAVGMLAGCLYVRLRSADPAPFPQPRLSRVWSWCGAALGVGAMAAVMLTGSMFFFSAAGPVEAPVFAALNRPTWAAGVALVVLCCSFGSPPVLKSFLSWRGWVAPSKLAYGVYLVHSALIFRDVPSFQEPSSLDFSRTMLIASGDIAWSTALALVLYLLVEAPACNLLNVCITPQKRDNKVTPETEERTDVVDAENKQSNNGHLQDNLPRTVCLSKC